LFISMMRYEADMRNDTTQLSVDILPPLSKGNLSKQRK
jgi:hypothetical protein